MPSRYFQRAIGRASAVMIVFDFFSASSTMAPNTRARIIERPGQKIQAILYENRIELVPVRPVRKLKGFLNGIDTDVPREGDRV